MTENWKILRLRQNPDLILQNDKLRPIMCYLLKIASTFHHEKQQVDMLSTEDSINSAKEGTHYVASTSKSYKEPVLPPPPQKLISFGVLPSCKH